MVGEYERTGTTLLYDGETKYEFTSFRKDVYGEGGRHTPDLTIPTESIVEDALRRDFKCNAIYFDIKKGQFVDPLGGIKEVENKVISTVKDATEVFSHDGLRLMRLARQSAELNFTPSKETLLGAKINADKIKDVSVERIVVELTKILESDKKHPFSNPQGHYDGLKVLDQIGVLDIILPELTLGRDMAQREDYHDHDVLEHTFRSVLYAPSEIRLAMLLHDVGKPYCMQRFSKYHMHEHYGEKIARDILNRLKVSSKLKEEVLFIVKNHMLDMKEEMRETRIRKFIAENHLLIPKLLLAKQADYSACKDDLGKAPTVIRWQGIINKMKEENIPFSIKDLEVNGNDLKELGLEKKDIGKTLKKMHQLVLNGEKKNEKETLLAIITRQKG